MMSIFNDFFVQFDDLDDVLLLGSILCWAFEMILETCLYLVIRLTEFIQIQVSAPHDNPSSNRVIVTGVYSGKGFGGQPPPFRENFSIC